MAGRPLRRARNNISLPLLEQYRAYDKQWFKRQDLVDRFNNGEPPVVATRALEFPILGGGIMRTRSEERVKDRPFVVVEVSPGKRRAFYMSTGTGGQTDSGEWNLFGGVADKQLRVSLGWFIKPREGKRVEKYTKVSEFLTDLLGNTVEKAWSKIQDLVPDTAAIVERDTSSEAARAFGTEVNRYLHARKAIAEFSDDEKGRNTLPFYDVEDPAIPKAMQQYPTVYAARRVAFNPRMSSMAGRPLRRARIALNNSGKLDPKLLTPRVLNGVVPMLRWLDIKPTPNRPKPLSSMPVVPAETLVLLRQIHALTGSHLQLPLPSWPIPEPVQGSLLHRWIIIEAVISALEMPKIPKTGKACIDASIQWVLNPTTENEDIANVAAEADTGAAAKANYDKLTYLYSDADEESETIQPVSDRGSVYSFGKESNRPGKYILRGIERRNIVPPPPKSTPKEEWRVDVRSGVELRAYYTARSVRFGEKSAINTARSPEDVNKIKILYAIQDLLPEPTPANLAAVIQ